MICNTEPAAAPAARFFSTSRREMPRMVSSPDFLTPRFLPSTLHSSLKTPLLRFAQQILRSAPGERHDRQCRILVRIGDQRRAIGNKQILDVVRLAIAIQ